MELKFDENGYLTPYQPLVTTLEIFKETFVKNPHRWWLFNKLSDLIDHLQEAGITQHIGFFLG